MASSSAGSSEIKLSPARSSTPSTASTAMTAMTPPTSTSAEKAPDDSSKLRLLLGILRKFLGVADIAAVRFSLPTQLLEPTPNLEYWNYLDRPETFIGMGDSDDPQGRMLAVMRFWFTKDLKYVKGKPCKPYNSALGEFFRCNWEVTDEVPPLLASAESAPASPEATADTSKPYTVSYITEQTSHHPPVSAFVVSCPEKGVTARGFDQISAKFTGTSIRVTPGQHNLGIFITLHNRDEEEYQLTHPAAHLGGFLRGALNVTVADMCYITCPKTSLKAILHYVEEGWLGRSQNRVNGLLFRYDPAADTITRLKDVPAAAVLARIEGCWQDKLYYTLPGAADPTEKHLLIDLNPLHPATKVVPPEDQQLPNESRRFWHDVTDAILKREYNRATIVKQGLEERQREKARERHEAGVDWTPRFFTGVFTPVGRPELSADGEEALRGMQGGKWALKESEVTGA